MTSHVLVARLDSAGDVLLMGPAVRAVRARADRVTLLTSPLGRPAAALLPGVDELVVWRAPWIDPDPEPVSRRGTLALVRNLARLRVHQALIFTSFHQNPLPLALLLRLAGVPVIAAISDDYPGSLLDVRHRIDGELHEVERALSLAATLGFGLPAGDDGRLAIVRGDGAPRRVLSWSRYVVVHPGASVPARAWAPERNAELIDRLVEEGYKVVVTGSPGERELVGRVVGRPRAAVRNLAGRLDFAELAEVIARSDVLVVGNTGPAHLAAAVGTPVVSLFAPTVPATRWHPWRVPHVILGRQDIACAGCRARRCPLPGQPCLAPVTPDDVLRAIERLRTADPRIREPAVQGVPV